MRHIDRLTEPSILSKKKEEWTKKFIESGRERPDNSKYGHLEIHVLLGAMSFHKCFYCETMLKGTPKEIDHFIEVVENKELAFEWTNLYLACDNCNDKLPNRIIDTSDVLNPCRHTDEEIKTHLTFEDEVISSKNNSILGLRTIQKYKLDSGKLDYLRGIALKRFHQELIKIQQNQIQENGRSMNEQEREKLRQFTQRNQPYSLMFEILLEKYQI
ncbi:MAG: HNH endonuclease [Thermoflexibacter sp.]|jgi:5-methylcytosine-specific restriction endonuclease McrA|nr:HNH endonuclease [Thermoflexibacter sp.]